MKTLLALFFAIGTAYAQQPLLGGGNGGGGTGTAPYVVPSFTGSPQTITAATHGQGKDAQVICWYGAGQNCSWTNADPTSATAGDIVLTYTATPTRVIIYTPGQGGTGQQGIQGPAGSGNNAYCPDATGSTTTYSCPTPSPTVTTLTGLLISFIPQTTNSGSGPTVNVGALGAKTLKQSDCSTNVTASSLTGGLIYQFAYNGTSFCAVGTNGGGGVTVAADASGSTTTYTSTGSPVPASLTNGLAVDFIPQTTNTGSSTLNLNSLGAKSIVYSDGTAIPAGGLVATLHYLLTYDSAATVFRVPVTRLAAGSTNCLTDSYAVSPATIDINTACVPQLTAANAFTGLNSFTPGIQFPQGTALTPAANSIVIEAPASVTTAYKVNLPGAAGTGFTLWTNSSNVVTESIVASTGTGNVLRASAASPVQNCGTTTSCAASILSSPQVVMGSAALVTGTPSTATITGISPAFTSASTYVCTLGAQSSATGALLSVANVSGSSFTITGPAAVTTVINYICVGN